MCIITFATAALPETSTNIFGTDNGDAEAHVHSKRDEWVATVNSALVAWANTTVEDPVKQWWDNFVYQNSPYFYPPDPPSGPQVGAYYMGVGALLRKLLCGPAYHPF
jgi:hypothetical protein